MAFESLSEKLGAVFKKLRGKGRINEADIKEAMREVRLALLEADVSYKVAKDFIAAVSARAVGIDVLESLTPAQMVVKIVSDEMRALMGGDDSKLNLSSNSPSVVMLVGLQGAGKTTNGAKLAEFMRRRNGKRPLLVACDIYRPAAIEQLQTVGDKLGIPVFQMGKAPPADIAKAAVSHAKKHGNDIVFLDTAGRLHIDEELMGELLEIKDAVNPHEILLVLDAMTGQDAVNAAQAFDSRLGIGGVMLTKLDGDARGGAALSVRAVTGKPIKFVGLGEKLDQIDVFHPERMASRILGMGDVLTLIERAERSASDKHSEEMAQRLLKNQFTLTDYYEQLQQLKSMGGASDVLRMLPGADSKMISADAIDESAMTRTEAIILSMTPYERANPAVLGSSRKKRISAGSGVRVSDVNRLIKQFESVQTVFKQFSRGKMPAAMSSNKGLMKGLMQLR
ncbi:MAG: signal recognition particle protein [Oscillospiraceae bacterium]|jgi:signal recognition particle subunit SRP54|nr:signal recognition particle protein [Oscillospiraceae bacterium]